ncbi:hypothetical protein ACJRO7_031002 [Eucalyptus globulus]|uniref:Coiled-coil domain-containing protein 172 n=1 Tax=Eucalyptus globulus TaxID=34317 RepID=A0ABD3JR92_EUCGL
MESKVKALLSELNAGKEYFPRTPGFQLECEEFLTLFNGRNTKFKKNYDKIAVSTMKERTYNALKIQLAEQKTVTKESRQLFQVVLNEEAKLLEEKRKLQEQLAEVDCQHAIKRSNKEKKGQLLKRHFKDYDKILKECDRQQTEIDEQIAIKQQCIAENNLLDQHLFSFGRNVKKLLDTL